MFKRAIIIKAMAVTIVFFQVVSFCRSMFTLGVSIYWRATKCKLNLLFSPLIAFCITGYMFVSSICIYYFAYLILLPKLDQKFFDNRLPSLSVSSFTPPSLLFLSPCLLISLVLIAPNPSSKNKRFLVFQIRIKR